MAQLNSLSIQGQPVVDYVVEQQTTSTYSYRKWSSGKVECWIVASLGTFSISRAYGSLFYSETLTQQTPAIFNTLFSINAQINENSGSGLASVHIINVVNNNDKTCTVRFWVSDATSESRSGYTANFYLTGTWK